MCLLQYWEVGTWILGFSRHTCAYVLHWGWGLGCLAAKWINVPGRVLGGGVRAWLLNGYMCLVLGGWGFEPRLLNGY